METIKKEAAEKSTQKQESLDKEIELKLPQELPEELTEEFFEIERYKKVMERLGELKEDGNIGYVRFINGIYMLEVRELTDLKEKLDGVYGDDQMLQNFI